MKSFFFLHLPLFYHDYNTYQYVVHEVLSLALTHCVLVTPYGAIDHGQH